MFEDIDDNTTNAHVERYRHLFSDRLFEASSGSVMDAVRTAYYLLETAEKWYLRQATNLCDEIKQSSKMIVAKFLEEQKWSGNSTNVLYQHFMQQREPLAFKAHVLKVLAITRPLFLALCCTIKSRMGETATDEQIADAVDFCISEVFSIYHGKAMDIMQDLFDSSCTNEFKKN